jgi:prophage antirepressor-like protein
MNNAIQIFENKQFGKIRTLINEKGETWFVGKDVANALGYYNTRDALAKHVAKDDKTTVAIRDTGSNYKSQAVLVNESGLYALIFGSKLPSAKAFKRWVTSEVLPQIRKTGGYIPTKDSRTGKRLSDKEIVRTASQILQRTIAAENAPAEGCLSSSEVAKALGLELKDFFLLMDAAGVIEWKCGRRKLTKAYAERGLAEDRYFHYYTLNGQKCHKPYLAWTAEGFAFIKGLLGDCLVSETRHTNNPTRSVGHTGAR